jgi:hypothetical protein
MNILIETVLYKTLTFLERNSLAEDDKSRFYISFNKSEKGKDYRPNNRRRKYIEKRIEFKKNRNRRRL